MEVVLVVIEDLGAVTIGGARRLGCVESGCCFVRCGLRCFFLCAEDARGLGGDLRIVLNSKPLRSRDRQIGEDGGGNRGGGAGLFFFASCFVEIANNYC